MIAQLHLGQIARKSIKQRNYLISELKFESFIPQLINLAKKNKKEELNNEEKLKDVNEKNVNEKNVNEKNVKKEEEEKKEKEDEEEEEDHSLFLLASILQSRKLPITNMELFMTLILQNINFNNEKEFNNIANIISIIKFKRNEVWLKNIGNYFPLLITILSNYYYKISIDNKNEFKFRYGEVMDDYIYDIDDINDLDVANEEEFRARDEDKKNQFDIYNEDIYNPYDRINNDNNNNDNNDNNNNIDINDNNNNNNNNNGNNEEFSSLSLLTKRNYFENNNDNDNNQQLKRRKLTEEDNFQGDEYNNNNNNNNNECNDNNNEKEEEEKRKSLEKKYNKRLNNRMIVTMTLSVIGYYLQGEKNNATTEILLSLPISKLFSLFRDIFIDRNFSLHDYQKIVWIISNIFAEGMIEPIFDFDFFKYIFIYYNTKFNYNRTFNDIRWCYINAFYIVKKENMIQLLIDGGGVVINDALIHGENINQKCDIISSLNQLLKRAEENGIYHQVKNLLEDFEIPFSILRYIDNQVPRHFIAKHYAHCSIPTWSSKYSQLISKQTLIYI